MRQIHLVLGSLAAISLSYSLAHADAISDWNKIALETVTRSARDAAQASRDMAAVHVAMFEAMNFFEAAYVPRFLVKPPAGPSKSGEFAAAAAAHVVLAELHPERRDALDAALDRSFAAMADARARSSTLIAGRQLGQSVHAVWPAQSTPGHTTAAPRRSPACASTRGTGASVAAWNSLVEQFIQARPLEPIDRARIHALVSMAMSEVHARSRDPGCRDRGEPPPCAPCAVGAAILTILEDQFRSRSVVKFAVPTSGMKVAVPTRTPIGADGADGDELFSERACSDVMVPGSIWAGEEMGRRIGRQMLTLYRPVERGGVQRRSGPVR